MSLDDAPAPAAEFHADWLALREPADLAARDPGLRAQFQQAVAACPGAEILDLGCGTGSTFRALAPGLPETTRWRLADHDPRLLAAAAARMPLTAEVVVERLDLSDLDMLVTGPATVVTASALFDLCSQPFVAAMMARLAAAGAPALYAALNYDGRMDWSLPHPLDAEVTAAFNHHQRGDKGFGPAMGAESGAGLAQAAEAAGFRVTRADSPWRLGPDQAPLQLELLAGIARAARETGRLEDGALDDWLDMRRAAVARTGCRAVIGHTDVLALRG
ncbi:methyltransferase domain-containing protein [Frigidibacter sp. MR17.24]|uniref:methyltransferase domain-containing protein n=1 Tax=Frigidibacter sp. MR17.24 TaxID=3127345 RepID=UPI003012B5B7